MAKSYIEATLTSQGSSTWVEAEVTNVPARYRILRARVEATGGGTQVYLAVREESGTTSLNRTPLEYGATLNPLDSPESEDEIYFQAVDRHEELDSLGTTWIAIKTNNSGDTVEVVLDIEEQ